MTIRVQEPGPLVASLVVESAAPDCYSLAREVRLVAGADYVEVVNVVDKQRILGTNYRPYQEGPNTLRFMLRPHAGYDPAAASQPLLAVRARGTPPLAAPRLRIESPDVIATWLKPSDDGRAIIVRLWGAAGKDVKTRLHGSAPAPVRVALSDTSERALGETGEIVSVPAWGVVALRADLR